MDVSENSTSEHVEPEKSTSRTVKSNNSQLEQIKSEKSQPKKKNRPGARQRRKEKRKRELQSAIETPDGDQTSAMDSSRIPSKSPVNGIIQQ